MNASKTRNECRYLNQEGACHMKRLSKVHVNDLPLMTGMGP